MRHTNRVSTFILALLLSACGGGEGEAGAAGVNSSSALVTVSAEAAGVNCASAGSKVEAGLDINRDGTLAAAEVTSTQYLCNGATGAAGSAGAHGASGAAGINGLNALVQMLDEPSGANCAAGGESINVGVDANASGVLEASEVSGTGYVCSGIDGTAGGNGTNGVNGASGTHGLNTLVRIAPELAGANCVYGGSKVSTGLDSNANSVLDVGEVSATSYVCNGAPDAALNWVNVTGTAQQADANTGYIASNDAAQVVVTLPLNPAPGDVVRISGAGLGGWRIAQNDGQAIYTKSLGGVPGTNWTERNRVQNWSSVASSSNGTKLVALDYNGRVHISIDSGASWTSNATEPSRLWNAVASSADGSKLVAGVDGGSIYTSTDGGATWMERATDADRRWNSLASSADGSKLVAVNVSVGGGEIYTSTDGGVNWTLRDSGHRWYSVASSADGSKLVAAEYFGRVYTSSDSGVSWTAPSIDSDRRWRSVASSVDGSKLVAVVAAGQVYTSTDSGTSWTARAIDSDREWHAAASSADGSKLAAVTYGGRVYTSTDSGATWTERASDQDWQSVASSADGSKLVAVVFRGLIYTSTISTIVGTNGSITGTQFDAITLQYVGGGMFNVLSHEGQLTAQ